ncbi:MAG: hypothetical protein ACFFDT_03695 [Candidatus Hodarchaeota archaeon]
MIQSNQRQHLFPLSLLLITSFAIGLIVIFSCYFDNDALFQVLIPIKRGKLSLKNIRPYAPLLPSILLIFNPYLDSLIVYIILGICAGVGTAFLVYWITVSQTKNRIVGILCMFMVLVINGTQILLRTLDDNLLPLPLVLLSFYLLFVETQQPAECQRRLRIFASGLLLSIAIAFHLHTVILMPLFLFYTFTDYRMQFKHRMKNSLIVFLGIISFFMPLVFLVMDARGTFSIGSLTTPTAYSPYFHQSKWYLFAEERTVAELIDWVFLWFAGMITYNSPFLLFGSPEYYSFAYQGILFFVSSIIWFGIIVGVPLFFLFKPFQEQKKMNLFVILGFLVFLMTSIFAFLFAPQDPERWALAIPFLVINFGIGLNNISKNKNFWNRFSQKFHISGFFKGFTRPKRWVSNNRLFGLLLICLALIKYSAGFAYAIMSPTHNDWPYPNKSIIDDIIQNVPENAPLILGPADDWNMVSYYRFGWTLYIRWDGQLQDAILWDNGRLSDLHKLNESSISSMVRIYLDRGIVVFAHEEAISFLQAQGFDTEYNLTVYKEFKHWSPLDLIKGERNPNRIYTLTRPSEG